jgi:hypothetical protein
MSKPFYNIVYCIYGCDTIDMYKKEILKVKETWGKAPSGPTDKAPSGPTDKAPSGPTDKAPSGATDKAPSGPTGKAPSGPTDKATQLDKAQNHLLFFLGEEGSLQDNDCIHLENIGDDYLSAGFKQYAGLKYIYENYNFNYVFICGTDTYVLTDNLIKFINEDPQISADKPLVFGGHGDNRQIGESSVHFFSGGAGIVLTKATMDIIYPELGSLQDEWMWFCTDNSYKTFVTACDLSLCYFLKRRGIIFFNVCNRFFNCNYLGYHSGVACCAKSVDIRTMISCHNMSLQKFDELEKILIGR